MISLSIVGFGNVGSHLFQVFKRHPEIELIDLFSRSAIRDQEASRFWCNDFELLKKADIYILAVSDDQIGPVSAKLPFNERLVVHTSGSVFLNELHGKNRRGVFYPLQSFNRNEDVDFQQVPLCVEAESPADLDLLKKLGLAISDHVVAMNSEDRLNLHLAAVIVNNFTNHLFKIARDLLREQHIDFDLLKPLIRQTVNKLERITPAEAQTGPARRGDRTTIDKHLGLLEESDHLELYELMTDLIQQTYGKKL